MSIRSTSVRSGVRIRVERSPMSSTVPVRSPNRHVSPTRTGQSLITATPPNRFSIVFWAARARAKPPAPTPASTAVVKQRLQPFRAHRRQCRVLDFGSGNRHRILRLCRVGVLAASPALGLRPLSGRPELRASPGSSWPVCSLGFGECTWSARKLTYHNSIVTSPAACGSIPIPSGVLRWFWDMPSSGH